MLQFSQFPIKPQVLSGAHKPSFFISILLNTNLRKKQFIALILRASIVFEFFLKAFCKLG